MEGLFRGTWYRSSVKLEGENITPIPPFQPYNPFDRYFPASEIRQGEKKSLYLEFISVNAEKPEEILSFCERFGVLGNTLVLSHIDQNKKKTSFGKTMEGITKENVWNPNRSSPIDISSILQNLPMPIRHFRQEQKDLADVIKYSQKPNSNAFQEFSFEPLEIYVNKTIKESSIEPQLNWNPQEEKWELVWISLSLTGYLTLMLMLDLLGPGKILSCPRCHKFFMTASNRMKYCSSSCCENFKVQKYQKKKKEEIARKVRRATGKQSAGKKK
ncbi:MAG: hypothetical protein NPIRA06_03430 [Nitrospirales bacterium]|nr:MAG: hypothetical protein NPIRA06_03430 [Nitrospirales bacterium]